MRKKNLIKLTKAPIASIALLTLLWVGCEAGGLRGVGLYESSTFNGISVSMAGGGLLNIAGQDTSFDGAAISNTVSFETDDLTGQSQTFELPRLSENDQYMSAPVNNRLVYTTPAINTLFAGTTPMSAFESFDKVVMNLSVTTSVLGLQLTCGAANNCKVKYEWNYTPIIYYMIPSMVYPGMTASVAINPKRAPWYKAANQLPIDLRIDGTSMNLTANYDSDSTLSTDYLTYVAGTVQTDVRNSTGEVTAFFRGAGYAMNDTSTIETCAYDDTTCYRVKVMPTVSAISHNAGHAEGGQLLTITGTSLDGDTVTVTVDDLACDIESISQTEITCTTSMKTIDLGASTPASYIGQQGLNLYGFASGNYHQNWRTLVDTDDMLSKTLYTAMDLAQHIGDYNSFKAFEGFFKAPVTGQFRFLMSCDDSCTFKINTADKLDPAEATEILSIGSWDSYRTTDIEDKSATSTLLGAKFSEWINLTQDEYYYVESTLWQGSGSINLNVGMEIIPNPLPSDHSKLEKQVQRMSLGQTNILMDTLQINILDCDEGIFKLAYLEPGESEEPTFWQSGDIIAGGDEAQFLAAIQGFYSRYGVVPIVTRTFIDSLGVEYSEEIFDVHTVRYIIETPMALSAATVETIMYVPTTTAASVEIIYPDEANKLSSPPLSGTFYVSCYNNDGNRYSTEDMDITSVSATSFKNVLERDCSFLSGNISVTKMTSTWANNAMGVEFQINFHGIAGDLGQYELKSGIDPLVGVDIVYDQSIVREFGQSLVWHVIPPDQFFTRETEPQLMVTVDSMPALCSGMACNYLYSDGTALITGFALSGTALSITGSDFTTPEKIEMGQLACSNIVVAATFDEITCDLAGDLPAGNWFPQVTEDLGKVKIDPFVAAEQVALEVTSVLPNIDLNPYGGDLMTIEGTNFPASLDARYNLQILLGGTTRCVPYDISSTQILCETEPFSSRRRRVLSTVDAVVSVQSDDGTASDTVVGLTMDATPITATAITPTEISPIALTTITIELIGTYPTSGMTKDDFTVTMIPDSLELSHLNRNNDGIRQLNVVAVDTSLLTITVKYGGAYSGTYDLLIKSTTNGNLDTSAFQLKVVFELLDFQPQSGSIYGGTKLTLTGGPFTDDLKETFVKVGYKWWEEIDHYCYVISVSANEVTCRLPLDLNREAKEYEVILFAATYEESNCEMDNNCLFTFVDASTLPEVTAPASAQFDQVSGEYQIVITGSGFTDAAGDIDFELGGTEQTVLSATSSEIVVQVDSLENGLTTSTTNLYLAIGLPRGYTELQAGITFSPKLLSLSTSTGSAAGSLITAVVKGVGVNDQVTLYDDANGKNICQTSTVTAYGQLECLTIAEVVAAATDLSIKEVESGTVHACAASDSSDCQYETYDAVTTQMTVASVALSSETELTFTGSNLPSDTCEAVFLGQVSDSCTRQSDSSVVATFDKGLPTTSTDTLPQLRFIAADGTHYALIDATAVIQNPLSISSTTDGVSSSFAGGQTLQVQAPGLTSDVMLGRSEIRVCGKPCSIIDSESSSSIFACSTPAISTKKSNSEFTIQEETNLKGESVIYSGMTIEEAESTLDDAILPSISNSQSNCSVGVQFPTDYIGVVNEISFFLDEFDVSLIVNHLKIEASTDNFGSSSSTELLVEVSEEVHEGWNYYDLSDLSHEFQYFRIRSTANWSGCNSIGEIHYMGYEVINDDNDTYQCKIEHVELTTDSDGRVTETKTDLSSTVTYDVSITPVVDDIQPRWGAVSGGTQITFEGRNFSSGVVNDYKITIDDVDCPVDSVSSTELKCTTAERIGEWNEDPKLEITMVGAGNFALQGQTYRYCALWSEDSTWGDLLPPIDGESVAVPNGLCLLVDIKNSPKLRLVQVDGGALIFPSYDNDPSYEVTFDARYIMINNGTLEIGTEKHPYKNKLTITMYGEKYDPPMPIFGKKSIGVSFGVLDIHGVHKKSWTDLDSTVQAGDTQLTVVEEVDWEVGDHLMITSTDYDMYHTEFKNIIGISSDGSKSTITLDTAFEHMHYAGRETYGDSGDFLEIRAEVCLMSRNIIYRGDPETSAANKFGAHIMLHSPGDESVIGRIENLQLNDVGQAFLLGKYPIHYHMIGRVTKSYVRNNAVMRSYNRGTTIHGVKYLRVERNCYWDAMGHTIFVEDAAETKNYIAYNVVAGTKPSFSLLNTDQTPGCFWITHPDNIFVGNRAAGSVNYGYWMDYQDTAIGPSFDPNIKPTLSKLGEFRNNVAHSVGNYGLRIFHGHNPPQPAYYEDHLSYHCGKNGVMGGDYGHVVFRNITVADNANSGIEFERIVLDSSRIDECHAEDLTIIGVSNGNPGKSTHGIVAPQSDLWFVTNARFYNFKEADGAAALGDCSHCETPKADSGTRTTRFSQLTFTDVDWKIRWRWPFKGIFHDLDGTLTEQGADSYVSADWKHNEWPECIKDLTVYDGIICAAPRAIQRIVFHGAAGNINGRTLYIWQYDDDNTDGMDDAALESYLLPENASELAFLAKARPSSHWTAPYVTDHRYYLRWLHGLDFETVNVQIEPYIWEQSDKSVEFVAPHYEVRETIEFEPANSGLQANETLLDTSEANLIMGHNVVYNETETREMHFVVNGRDDSSSMLITGYRCKDYCKIEEVEPGEDRAQMLWSNIDTWTNLPGRIPEEGDEVEIMDGWDVVYDIGTSPVFKNLQINGKLSFQRGEAAVLQSYAIWIRAGEVNVGTEDEPFDSTVEIRLHGNNTSPSEFVFAPQIPVGNKNLIVTGKLNMFGTPRQRVTRLLEPAYPNSSTLIVSQGLDFVNGDKLGLPATNVQVYDSETVIVESYDPFSGVVTLTEPLKGYHYGHPKTTAGQFSGVDMRGEVLLLTSNVNVTASTDSTSMTLAYPRPFGCQILVSDFFEPADFTYRYGEINLDNISVFNCSQEFTNFAAIKFHYATKGVKRVTNSAISSGLGKGILIFNSQDVTIENNVIHDFIFWGIGGDKASNVLINNNVINGITPDTEIYPWPYMKWVGYTAAVNLGETSSNYVVTNNIAASAWHAGFMLPAYKCGETQIHTGNVAHSISGYGLIVQKALKSGGNCYEWSDFKGYKTRIATVHMGGGLEKPENKIRDIVVIDSSTGLMAFGAGSGHVEVKDSVFYGGQNMPNKDCPNDDNCDQCISKRGMWIPTFAKHTKGVILAPDKLQKMFAGGGSWGGTSLFKDLTFIGYDNKQTECGGSQAAIVTNNVHPDYHPLANFRNIEFKNTDQSAMFAFGSPSPGWANLSDCGIFTCTGLYNVLVEMEGTKFSGIPSVFGVKPNFQVTAHNKESISVQDVANCEKVDDWNAWKCDNSNLGVLLFESQDGDRMDRSSQPLYLQDLDDDGNGFNNRLNAYMDTCWDGAYTCQKREQRFPTFLDISRNYTIEYTGTPPQKQKFSLYSDSSHPGTLITIRYPDAGAYKIYNEMQELVEPTDWDYNTETWAVPSGRECGENRYVGVKNFLEFWIEPGCTIFVYPRDAIMLAIRLEWTVKEFFQSDGIGKFTDRMAAVLGIHKADLKVVQVYEGSVIVEFQVLTEEGDENPAATLQAIEQKFQDSAPTLGDSLGAPVMQVVTSSGNIVAMEGYEDISALQNNGNFVDLISQFEQSQAEEAEKDQSIWEGMTEVVEDEDEESESDTGTTDVDDNTDTDSDQEDDKEKTRVQITKTQIITEIVTKEEPISESTTESILIVIVAVLALIVFALICICLYKRKRRDDPRSIQLPNESAREVKTEENVSFEINEKPQFNAHKSIDLLGVSGTRRRSGKQMATDRSLRSSSGSGTLHNSQRGMVCDDNDSHRYEEGKSRKVSPIPIDDTGFADQDSQRAPGETAGGVTKEQTAGRKGKINLPNKLSEPKKLDKKGKFAKGIKSQQTPTQVTAGGGSMVPDISAPAAGSTILPDINATQRNHDAAADGFNQNQLQPSSREHSVQEN